MKKFMVVPIALVMLLGFATTGYADLSDLEVKGMVKDADGNYYNLIYDKNRDITWYDYKKSAANWDTQNLWAKGLNSTLTYGGNEVLFKQKNGTNTSWRLPSTSDGIAGYNTTGSEMGYLFYEELGKTKADYSQHNVPSVWGFKTDIPFKNLSPAGYWSGTESDSSNAWYFYFNNGYQNVNDKNAIYYALAVHDGIPDLPTPIPGTFGLLGSGLAWLAAWGSALSRRRQ